MFSLPGYWGPTGETERKNIVMWIEMLKSKLHRARVTESNINYPGSLTVDEELMEEVGIREYERVLVGNLSNGNRFETYVIKGERNSGSICLNGATARLGEVGDILIILSFAWMDEEEAKHFRPKIVVLDPENRVMKRSEG
jgi:aspartate 1-decarboxylase